MIRWMTLVVVLAAVPALFAGRSQDEGKMTEEQKAAMKKLMEAKAKAETQPASTQPAAGLAPQVTLETTLGNIVLELDGDKAPISTKNFLDYVDAGFYNGTIFHRVVSNFMIQGGGFTPDMDEKKDGLRPPIKNEWKNGLKNMRGTIAMARTQVADSATAQFFINVVDNGMLDQPRDGAAYAVFGKVTAGMDIVDKIRDAEVQDHPKLPMGKVVPKETIVVKSAKVTRDCDRKKLEAGIAAAPKAAPEAEAKTGEGQQKAVEDFLKKVETETGKKVEKTASGLMYVILKEGTGPAPKRDDSVEVSYYGTFIDGTKFDSSEKFGFSLKGGVIKGWLEGVAMMKVGEKRKLICPPDLAYGPGGRGKIPPNATLVFDVELLAIK